MRSLQMAILLGGAVAVLIYLSTSIPWVAYPTAPTHSEHSVFPRSGIHTPPDAGNDSASQYRIVVPWAYYETTFIITVTLCLYLIVPLLLRNNLQDGQVALPALTPPPDDLKPIRRLFHRECEFVPNSPEPPLKTEEMHLWREAMAHLRAVHNDFWSMCMFFMAVNALLMTLVTIGNDSYRLLLSIGGIITCIIAMMTITDYRRKYYVQALLRKSMIEKSFGIYSCKVHETHLAFPYTMGEDDWNAFKCDPRNWADNRSPLGDVTGSMFFMFIGIVIFYSFIMIIEPTAQGSNGV